MNEMVDRVLEIMQSRGLMADESDARAVIEAMSEPTEAMCKAAAEAHTDESACATDYGCAADPDAMARIWNVMIASELKTA